MYELKKRLSERFKIIDVFFSSLLFFLTAHGYIMVNLAYNHDSTMMITSDDIEQFELGRWLVPYYDRYARDGVVTYWLTMVISFFALFIICLIVSDTFNFKLYQTICLSAAFTVNITLICLYSTYIPWADIQVISTALGCLAIWILYKSKHPISHFLSALLFCMSMALYQAQINFALGLSVLILINECINNDLSFKDIFKKLGYYISHVIAGGILYLIGMFVTKYRYNIIFRDSYNGPGSVANDKENILINSIKSLWTSIRFTFDFFTNQLGAISIWMKYLGIIMIVSSIIILLYILIFEIKNNVKTAQILLLLIAFVIAVNAMFAVTDGMVHTLMIYSYYLVYVLCIYICGLANEKLLKPKKSIEIKAVFTALVCGCIIYSTYMNSVYANNIYLKKTLTYNQAARALTTVWKDITEIDGYVEGSTPIVFICSQTGDNTGGVYYYNSGFNQYISDNPFVGVDVSSVFTDANTVWQSWTYIIGRGKVEVDTDLIEENDYIANMPSFPSKGYCELIDGQVIVKWAK